MLKSLILIVLCCLSCSCASIIGSKKSSVAINSDPAGAKVEIVDTNGVQKFVGTTPTTAFLDNGDGYFTKARYTAKFEKDGHQPQILKIDPSMNHWYWGNILIGGVIGMLIVDPLTGAMYEIDPAMVNTTLPLKTSESDKQYSSASGQVEDKLKKLDQLKKDGLLTESEYISKRKETIGKL